jgi:hypothetical protein
MTGIPRFFILGLWLLGLTIHSISIHPAPENGNAMWGMQLAIIGAVVWMIFMAIDVAWEIWRAWRRRKLGGRMES